MKHILSLLLLVFAGCAVESESKVEPAPLVLPWTPVATLRFEPFSGHTALFELPEITGQQTLRVTSAPNTCIQVTSAMSDQGEELAKSSIRSPCPDCQWRTSIIRETGLLIMEGRAKNLRSIGFARVDCNTFSVLRNSEQERQVVIERLITPVPVNPGIQVRLVLSRAIDIDLLRTYTEAELGIAIDIAAVESIVDTDILLQGSTDTVPLQRVLEQTPARDEGIIDVVYGPCLERETAFGVTRLAGLTPRIPGGAGQADAVFVARRTCGSRSDIPDDPIIVARVLAHELGHYLGLIHPEELDGTADDLPSTDTKNLMHREPLRIDSTGLTEEQRERLLAHPFVFDFPS